MRLSDGASAETPLAPDVDAESQMADVSGIVLGGGGCGIQIGVCGIVGAGCSCGLAPRRPMTSGEDGTVKATCIQMIEP